MCKQVEHDDMSSNHKRINIKYDKISSYQGFVIVSNRQTHKISRY